MEDSKSKTGSFSEKGKWGKSSVSYSVSIKELPPAAWAEIKAGTLNFVKFGNQPLPKRDPRALIINCYDVADDTEQQPASPVPVSAPHIPDTIHNTLESQSLSNSPLCADLATDMFIREGPSNSQSIAVTDTHHHAQPPISILSPFMQEDLSSENLLTPSSSGLHWDLHSDGASAVHQNISSTNMFTYNGGFVEGHPFVVSSLGRGNTFLTGPLATINADSEH